MFLYLIGIYSIQVLYTLLVFQSVRKNLTRSQRSDFFTLGIIPLLGFFWSTYLLLEYSQRGQVPQEDTIFKFWDVVWVEENRKEVQGIVLESKDQELSIAIEKEQTSKYDDKYKVVKRDMQDIRIFKNNVWLDKEAELLRKAQLIEQQTQQLVAEGEKIRSQAKVQSVLH